MLHVGWNGSDTMRDRGSGTNPNMDINVVDSTRLEVDKTRKDTSGRDDGKGNTHISTSNIELNAEGRGNSGDRRLEIE
jgi:hypothetical protein